MAKTQEQLNTLKQECETLNNKLNELSEDELRYVTGGNTNSSTNNSLPSIGYIYKNVNSSKYVYVSGISFSIVTYVHGSMQNDGKVHSIRHAGHMMISMFGNQFDLSNPISGEYWVD